MLLSLL